MSDTEVNWSSLKKAADDATKPIPDGWVVGEITKASWKTNSSGNPMYSVTVRALEGPAQGRTFFNNFNVSVDSHFALAIFFRHMEALGLDDAFFASGPSHDTVVSALVGRRASWEIGQREWQGRIMNDVKNIKALDAMAIGLAELAGAAPIGLPSQSISTPSGPPVPPSVPSPPTNLPTPPQTPFDS